ncbi:MAG: hypothetical protein K6T85_05750 [Gorillibacterium sp.]|nr:hypothetical protein [Gorillibacterium sp.]
MEVVVNRGRRLAVFGYLDQKKKATPLIVDFIAQQSSRLKEYPGYTPLDISQDGRFVALNSNVTEKGQSKTELIIYDREQSKPSYRSKDHLIYDVRFDASGTKLAVHTLRKSFIFDLAAQKMIAEWKEDLFLSKGTIDYEANRLYVPLEKGKLVLIYHFQTGMMEKRTAFGERVTQMTYLDKRNLLVLSTKENIIMGCDPELEKVLWRHDCSEYGSGKNKIWPCPLWVTEDNQLICVYETGDKGNGYVITADTGQLHHRIITKRGQGSPASAWFGDDLLMLKQQLLNLTTEELSLLQLPKSKRES